MAKCVYTSTSRVHKRARRAFPPGTPSPSLFSTARHGITPTTLMGWNPGLGGRYAEGMAVATWTAGELRLEAVATSRLNLDTGCDQRLFFGWVD